MLNFDSLKTANGKAIELLAKMRERFPGNPCTITIIHWEDDSFSVECRHGGAEIAHVYTYRSSKDETEYLKIDITDAELEESIGTILERELIS